MKLKLILLTLLISGKLMLAQTQTKFYIGYDWDKKPTLSKANDAYKSNDFYTVSEKHVFEYAYDSNNELCLYETRHVITHINSDKGVETKNKMYIPSGKIIEMIDLKARCITSSGKVVNLDKANIKQVDNLDDQGPFTIFAYEGVEPNCDIEFVYTAKKYIRTYGSYDTQFSFPQQKLTIDFISPKNLVFELRSYNGLKNFESDTTNSNINHLVSKNENIEEFEEEKYSADDANKQRFDYHLRYNYAKSKSKYYTWNLIGNELLENYTGYEKSDIKAIQKIIDKSGALKKATDLEKMAEFENYFKREIVFSTDAPNTLTIEKAISQKLINAFLLNRVFVEASNQMGLTYELVFTNNRFSSAFDGTFDGYHQLEEMLIYYPSLGKYLAPANAFSRIGFPPSPYAGNKGLFVKITEVAGVVTGISKVKTIGTAECELSQNTINAKINFTGEDFTPKAEMSHVYTGYVAYNLQPIFYVLTEAQKKENCENILKQPGEQTIVKNFKYENTGALDILRKPFIISGNIELPQLIEKAGDKFLFKLGMIIGPQSELYQEKVRKTNIELEYAHGFVRNLEVTIPDGYKVSNLKDINFNVVLTEDGKETAYFKSSYQLSGQKLTITISEQYVNIFYAKEKYKEYKDVINAAADFNKVTLILEKI